MADGVIARVEAQLAELKLRLPGLEGKANKRERTQVNREIYNLENDEAYVAAVKASLDTGRAQQAAAEDEAHAEALKREAAADDARAEAAAKRREEAAAAAAAGGGASVEDDGESHLEIKLIKKGDGQTFPKPGDNVHVQYTGTFAAGTFHDGRDLSGKEFDSTWQAKRKEHKPLAFQLGAGRVIHGWEECLLGMSLGGVVEATIGPKWAYRKGGVQDDEGGYVIPPNATLCFHMELVGVRGQMAGKPK
jgi:FKBP-type peptidyl-prolyl cis-trans isomerase